MKPLLKLFILVLASAIFCFAAASAAAYPVNAANTANQANTAVTTDDYPDNLIAIKAKTIITVSGMPLDNGVILIKGDRILQVGSDIAVPPGYRLLDYGDSIIYPGLINSMTTLGLSGVGFSGGSNDTREAGGYNPQVSAYTAFYPWSNLIPNTREFGTLIALSAPSGGIICGKAALVNLSGWTPEDMSLKKEAALMVKIPDIPAEMRDEKSPEAAAIKKIPGELKTYISKAYRYYQRTSTPGKNSLDKNSEDFDLKFAAMADLWEKNLPVIVTVERAEEIRFALKLGKEFNLRLILHSVYDGEKVIPEIKASGYPVILGSMDTDNEVWEDGCDKVFRLPALLAREGILFAFSTGQAAIAFDLPTQAGRAVAYGLAPEEAIKALTLYPARMLGIDHEYGSIAAGKIANLVIASGNILETSTVINAVFIKGRPITAKSFFQKEYQRAQDKISGEFK